MHLFPLFERSWCAWTTSSEMNIFSSNRKRTRIRQYEATGSLFQIFKHFITNSLQWKKWILQFTDILPPRLVSRPSSLVAPTGSVRCSENECDQPDPASDLARKCWDVLMFGSFPPPAQAFFTAGILTCSSGKSASASLMAAFRLRSIPAFVHAGSLSCLAGLRWRDRATVNAPVSLNLWGQNLCCEQSLQPWHWGSFMKICTGHLLWNEDLLL